MTPFLLCDTIPTPIPAAIAAINKERIVSLRHGWEDSVFDTIGQALKMLSLRAEVTVFSRRSLGLCAAMGDHDYEVTYRERFVGSASVPNPVKTPADRFSVATRKAWVATHVEENGTHTTPISGWKEDEYPGAVVYRNNHRLYGVAVSHLAGEHDLLMALLGYWSINNPVMLHHVGYGCRSYEFYSECFDSYPMVRISQPTQGQRCFFVPMRDPGNNNISHYVEWQWLEDGSRPGYYHLHVVTPQPRAFLEMVATHTKCELQFISDQDDQPSGVVWVIGESDAYKGVLDQEEGPVTIGLMASRKVPKGFLPHMS